MNDPGHVVAALGRENPTRPQLRVFVSSPGDVDTERKIAERVIGRLRGEFGSCVHLNSYFWEDEPMHLQITFQDQIPPTTEFDLVVCILWSRLGTPLKGPDGKDYPSGTAYEVETARAAFELTGTPELMLYLNQTPASIRQLPREERERTIRQLEALEDFVERHCYDQQSGVIKGAFTTYRDLGQFEELLEKHLRKCLQARLPEMTEDAGGNHHAEIAWRDRPYQGLRAFNYEHERIFFGRTRATGEVLALLRQRSVRLEEARAAAIRGLSGDIDPSAAAFVLVCAMSGVGKSSLVRAGVLPLMTQVGGGIGLWRRVVLRPGETPAGGDLFDAFVQQLTKPEGLPELLGRGGTRVTPQALAFELRRQPASVAALVDKGLSAAAESAHAAEETRLRAEQERCRREGRAYDVERLERQLAALAPPAARLAVVIDQMEELFILDGITAQTRQKFVQMLAALARSGLTGMLGTLRSDFFARCSEVPELMDLQQNGIYHLKPPTPEELGQIIRRPAQAAGLRFERRTDTDAKLDETLRDLAARSPEALPLLEFALDRLYDGRENGQLTWAAYEAMGGMEGALTTTAEAALTRLRPWQQETFAHVMSGLVTLGTGANEATAHRRTADYGALTAEPGAKAFVDEFIAARLFVADEDTAGRAIVSVAHEALLARHAAAVAGGGEKTVRPWLWARLGAWVEANADFLRTRARVSSALKQWQDSEEDAGFLLAAGRPLLDGKALLRDRPQALSAEERAYVERSVAADAQREGRRRRTRRLVLAALTALAISAGVGAWFGISGKRAAEERAQDAQVATTLAQQKTRDAQQATTLAQEKTRQAEQADASTREQLRQASLSDLVTAADLMTRGDWRASVSYARRALEHDPANEAAARWLWDALLYGEGDRDSLPEYQIRQHAGKLGVITLVYSPDGKRILTVTSNGKNEDDYANLIEQWDVVEGRSIGRTIRAELHSLPIYSPDSRHILIGTTDGRFQQWDADSGERFGPAIEGPEDRIASYSPDGKRILTYTKDGGLQQYNIATGAPSGKRIGMPTDGETDAIEEASYSPDGSRIVSLGDRVIRQWDAQTGKLLSRRAECFAQQLLLSEAYACNFP